MRKDNRNGVVVARVAVDDDLLHAAQLTTLPAGGHLTPNVLGRRRGSDYAVCTAAMRFSISCFQMRGPLWWTDSPVESTETVTGMSATSNS